MKSLSSEGMVQRRPDLFRALGGADPPNVVHLNKEEFRLERTLKHDSWAATALYTAVSGTRVVCKFGRTHLILAFFPFSWVSRMMAKREENVLRTMRQVRGFPRWAGPVSVNGRKMETAVSHYWIEGETFKPWLLVRDDFFPTLDSMIRSLHSAGFAHVDLAKWENILVGSDGRPYLLDYQLSFHPLPGWPVRWVLGVLQKADLYYLHRHWSRCRSDQLSPDALSIPVPVVIGEFLGSIWRPVRIMTLRLFGVRHDPRKDETTLHDISGSSHRE